MYSEFYDLIYNVLFKNYDLIDTSLVFEIGSSTLTMAEYLSTMLALVCTITVFLLVCMLIFKIVRLFGRLIGGGY